MILWLHLWMRIYNAPYGLQHLENHGLDIGESFRPNPKEDR